MWNTTLSLSHSDTMEAFCAVEDEDSEQGLQMRKQIRLLGTVGELRDWTAEILEQPCSFMTIHLDAPGQGWQ